MFHYSLYWSNPENHMEWSLIHKQKLSEQKFYDIIAECAKTVIRDLYNTNNFGSNAYPHDSECERFWIGKEGFEWEEIFKSKIFWKKMKEKGFKCLEYIETAQFSWGENITQHEYIGKEMKMFLKKNKYETVSNKETLMSTLSINGKTLYKGK